MQFCLKHFPLWAQTASRQNVLSPCLVGRQQTGEEIHVQNLHHWTLTNHSHGHVYMNVHNLWLCQRSWHWKVGNMRISITFSLLTFEKIRNNQTTKSFFNLKWWGHWHNISCSVSWFLNRAAGPKITLTFFGWPPDRNNLKSLLPWCYHYHLNLGSKDLIKWAFEYELTHTKYLPVQWAKPSNHHQVFSLEILHKSFTVCIAIRIECRREDFSYFICRLFEFGLWQRMSQTFMHVMWKVWCFPFSDISSWF